MQKSIVPSGFFGNNKENIVIIENFLEKKDLEELQYFSKNIKIFNKLEKENIWNDRLLLEEPFIKENRKLFIKLKYVYLNKIKNEIEKKFGFLLENSAISIATWRVGDNQHPHIDKEDESGVPSLTTPLYDFSSLIYINDDYIGGEIYFPNHGVEIKPDAGSLIFFPGDKNFPHGVKKILEGQRFTVPVFWTALKKL